MDKSLNMGEKWRYLYLMWLFIKRDFRPEDLIINWIKCPILGHLLDTLHSYLCPSLDDSDGVYAKAEQHEPSLSKFGVATVVQQQAPTLSLQDGAVPQYDRPVSLWWDEYKGLLPSSKDIFLPRTAIPSECRFTFPANSVFTKTTIHILIDYVVHCHDNLYSIASEQGIKVTGKEIWQWAYAHRITAITVSTHYIQVAVIM